MATTKLIYSAPATISPWAQMVSPILFDALREPSKEIQDLKTSQNSPTSDFVVVVEKYFRDLLSPHEALLQVSYIQMCNILRFQIIDYAL